MDLFGIQTQIETAVHQLQDGQTRVQADQFLQDLKKSSYILAIAKHMLEHSLVPQAQFQVISALRDSLSRIYAQQSAQERIAFKEFIMAMIITKFPSMERYTREKLIQTCALFVKLSYLSPDQTIRDSFFKQLSDMTLKLISTEDENVRIIHKRISLSLIAAILDEFASAKASSIGLPWDFHRECQIHFEKAHLCPLFELTLKSLHSDMQSGPFLETKEGIESIDTTLACSERILGWKFVAVDTMAFAALKSNRLRDEEDEICEAPVFPDTWKHVFLSPSVVGLFFELNRMFFLHTTIARRTRKCLILLSGLHGRVFSNLAEKKAYLSVYIELFVKDIVFLQQQSASNSVGATSTDDVGEKLLDAAQIGKNLLNYFKITVFISVSSSHVLLGELAKLTILCLNGAAMDADDLDDSWRMQTAEELLAMWSVLVTELEFLSSEDKAALQETDGSNSNNLVNVLQLLSIASFNIFEGYTNARLEIAKQTAEQDEDDISKDQDLYEDQLTYIGILARIEGYKSLTYLNVLLMERHQKLAEVFANPLPSHQPILATLYEQVHWLTLIAGHVLTDCPDGEKPLMPNSLQRLSATWPHPDSDPCIVLPTCIFNILDMFSTSPGTPQHEICSPLLVETLLWFVERWGCTYLFINPSDYWPNTLSQSIVAAFGSPGGAPQALDFLLDKIQRIFVAWHAELDVVLQIVSVVEGLSRNPATSTAFLSNPKFNGVVQFFLDNLIRLPATVHSQLIQTIAYIATHCTHNDRISYFKSISDAIEKMLVATIHMPDFMSSHQSPEIQEKVITVMEMYGGLALSADESNMVLIFETCSKQFASFVQLLELYKNFPEVELFILQFFKDLVKYQALDVLRPEHYQVLYSSILEVIRVYSGNQVGRSRQKGRMNEVEELNQDLSILFELLAGLLTAECEGLDEEEITLKARASTSTSVDVVQVVFFGVNQLIPLVTEEMLSFPSLCKNYIQLVAYLLEYFPHKLVELQPELLNSLVKSLLYGLNHPVSTLGIAALKAMESMALFYWVETIQCRGQPVAPLQPHLDVLLEQSLGSVLYRPFDSNLLGITSETVFALIVARTEAFKGIVVHIVSQQPQIRQQRISESFASIVNTIEKLETQQRTIVLASGSGSGGMLVGSHAGFRSNQDIVAFRIMFSRFLMEMRGWLVMK